MTPEEEGIEGEAIALLEVHRELEDLLGEWSPDQRTEVAGLLGAFLCLMLRRRTELGVHWREEQRDLLIRAVQRRKGIDPTEGGG